MPRTKTKAHMIQAAWFRDAKGGSVAVKSRRNDVRQPGEKVKLASQLQSFGAQSVDGSTFCAVDLKEIR